MHAGVGAINESDVQLAKSSGAPIIGFNANPLLVNGNMLAATYDTFGRYLFVGLTAKY